MDKIQIADQGSTFAVLFVQDGNPHEMDMRNTFADAEEFAFYLAARLKVDVYYRDKRLEPRRKR